MLRHKNQKGIVAESRCPELSEARTTLQKDAGFGAGPAISSDWTEYSERSNLM